MAGALLDTCALLWLSAGAPISPAARTSIDEGFSADSLFVSPITAWEVGVAVAKKRLVMDDPVQWFQTFRARSGVNLAPMDIELLVQSSFLPGDFHKDPADRIIVATARALGVPVVTRDRLILGYAEQGHVLAIAC